MFWPFNLSENKRTNYAIWLGAINLIIGGYFIGQNYGLKDLDTKRKLIKEKALFL